MLYPPQEPCSVCVFFFNHTATTEISTLSLHDALPISLVHPYDDPLVMAGQGTVGLEMLEDVPDADVIVVQVGNVLEDRKSTRLNSSHITISYAVLCLKKKKTKQNLPRLAPPTRNRLAF